MIKKIKLSKSFRIFLSISGTFFLFYLFIGFIVLPITVKWVLTNKISEQIQHNIYVRKIRFNPFHYSLNIDHLEVFDQYGIRMISFERLFVDFQIASLWSDDWQFQKISLEKPYINVILNRQGNINLTELIPIAPEQDTDETHTLQIENKSKKEAKYLMISILEITGGTILFQDKIPQEPFIYAIRPISTTLHNFNTHISKAGGMKITLLDGPQGTISVQGACAINPVQCFINFDMESFALSVFQPYINTLVPINIKSGFIYMDGQLTFNAGIKKDPTVGFNGKFRLTSLELNDPITKEPFVQWEGLNVNGIHFLWEDRSVKIEDVLLDSPKIKVVLEKTGEMNFVRLFSPSTQLEENNNTKDLQKKDVEASVKKTDESSSDVFNVHIAQFGIKEGTVIFQDQSIQPEFQIDLSSLEVLLEPISSFLEEPLQFNIKSTVDTSGDISLTGKVYPLDLNAPKTMALVLNNYETQGVSPYIQKYLGYAVEQGRLNLDIAYDMSPKNFQGKNHFLLHKFDLGNKVKSPDAVKLPIKFALSLLEDHKQQIDLTIPVKGDPSNPEFKYGHIIVYAFKNIFTKIVASPFSFLAGGGTDESESLDFIEFSPGSAEILSAQKNKLFKISEALKNRPKLILEIQGSFDPKIDLDALKESAFHQEYNAMLTEYNKPEQKIIEKMFKKYVGWKAFAKLRKNHKQRQKAQGQGIDSAKFYQEVRRQLVEQYQVETKVLEALAQKRVEKIHKLLIEEAKLDAQCIKVKQPIKEVTTSQKFVKLQLFLIPR